MKAELGNVDSKRIVDYARGKLSANGVMMIVIKGNDVDVATSCDPKLALTFSGILRKVADQVEEQLDTTGQTKH